MSLGHLRSHLLIFERKEFASAGIYGRAVVFARHLNANQRALKGDAGAIPIEIAIACRQALFRAHFSSFGTGEIDFCCKLGRFRENGDTVGEHFRKTANDGEMRRFLAASIVVTEFTNPQLRHERRVSWQYPQIAPRARELHFRDAQAEQLLRRRDHHELHGVGWHLRYFALAFIFSDFSRASSIVPTM
jgi:hypothetical protein